MFSYSWIIVSLNMLVGKIRFFESEFFEFKYRSRNVLSHLDLLEYFKFIKFLSL